MSLLNHEVLIKMLETNYKEKREIQQSTYTNSIYVCY